MVPRGYALHPDGVENTYPVASMGGNQGGPANFFPSSFSLVNQGGGRPNSNAFLCLAGGRPAQFLPIKHPTQRYSNRGEMVPFLVDELLGNLGIWGPLTWAYPNPFIFRLSISAKMWQPKTGSLCIQFSLTVFSGRGTPPLQPCQELATCQLSRLALRQRSHRRQPLESLLLESAPLSVSLFHQLM